MNAKLDSICRKRFVGISLGAQRCGCLFKLGEILNKHIPRGPNRKTKITPGIIKGSPAQETRCPGDGMEEYQQARLHCASYNQKSIALLLHTGNGGSGRADEETPGPPPTKLSHESVVKEPRRCSRQGLTPRTAGQEKLGDSSEDKALLELS